MTAARRELRARANRIAEFAARPVGCWSDATHMPLNPCTAVPDLTCTHLPCACTVINNLPLILRQCDLQTRSTLSLYVPPVPPHSDPTPAPCSRLGHATETHLAAIAPAEHSTALSHQHAAAVAHCHAGCSGRASARARPALSEIAQDDHTRTAALPPFGNVALATAAAPSGVRHARLASAAVSVAAAPEAFVAAVPFASSRAAPTASKPAVIANIIAKVHGHVQAGSSV